MPKKLQPLYAASGDKMKKTFWESMKDSLTKYGVIWRLGILVLALVAALLALGAQALWGASGIVFLPVFLGVILLGVLAVYLAARRWYQKTGGEKIEPCPHCGEAVDMMKVDATEDECPYCHGAMHQ